MRRFNALGCRIDGVMSENYRRGRGMPQRQGVRWTDSEEQLVLKSLEEGMGLGAIAARHQRKPLAVMLRLERLKS